MRMSMSHKIPSNCHARGYFKGDLRCIRCNKWLNPNIPEEEAQIWYGKNGKRHHFRCPVYASYPATLAMYSRQRRDKRIGKAKRY